MDQNRTARLLRGAGISAVALFLVAGAALGADAIMNQSPASSDATTKAASPIAPALPTLSEPTETPEPAETAEPSETPEAADDATTQAAETAEPSETPEAAETPEVGDDHGGATQAGEPVETAEPSQTPEAGDDATTRPIQTPEPGDDNGGSSGSSRSGGSGDDVSSHG